MHSNSAALSQNKQLNKQKTPSQNMISGINNKTCEKKKCSLENRFVTAKGEEIEEGWSGSLGLADANYYI